MGDRVAFPQDPDDFDHDHRISFARDKKTYILEDEGGQEWEWRGAVGRWAQAWTEDEEAQHGEVYGQADMEDAAVSINLPQKRKQANEEFKAAKAAKREAPKPKSDGKAVFVSNLPKTADAEQIESVFRKFGMIAESINDNEKRIKLYYDDDGRFKGEALIVYHRPESVPNACALADGAELDPVHPNPRGPMRVTLADGNYKRHTGGEEEAALPVPEKKNVGTNKDKKMAKKKAEEMDRRLAEWSDDEDEEALAQTGRSRVLMVTNAFRPRELQEDPDFRRDLEDDMREEAETHGTVVKIVIYDEDGSGAVAIHFRQATAAESCAKVFDGRNYNGRELVAYPSTGKENFKRSED